MSTASGTLTSRIHSVVSYFLEERYGSPELIEFCLKFTIARFLELTDTTHKKLYDLIDILSAIQPVIEDPKYMTLFLFMILPLG